MVRIKGKVEQSREISSAPLHLGVVAIEKGAFGPPSTKGRQLYFIFAFDDGTATLVYSDPLAFGNKQRKVRAGSI